MALSSFGRAFASARKAGKKTFTWNGKKYTTEVAKKTPKKGPVPTPNPRRKEPKRDIGASPKTGKVPVPKSNPRRDIGASPKTGKVPVPKSNPRNAPETGTARKGSRIAVAAQRRRERPVSTSAKAPDKPKVPTPRKAPDAASRVNPSKMQDRFMAKSGGGANRDIGAAPKTGKVPTPKSNPRNAPAVGVAKRGSAIAVAAQRKREEPKKKRRSILSILGFGD